MIEFKNYKDLMSKLSDEKLCREHMEEMRWNGRPQCPFCLGYKPYRLKDGKRFRCKEKTCKKTFSVTVGTVFENTKISLSTWIAATYVLAAHKKGISSCQLARDLGITQKTAWFVLHRLRLAMGEDDPEPLDNIVEVDETYVGGKMRNMHKDRRQHFRELGMDNKVAVMGLLQRDGKARLKVIGNDSFKDVIKDNVNEDAVLMTDSHLSYQGLDAEFAGHGTVNHTEGQYKDGMIYTNGVEGFFSQLKRSIFGIYHKVSAKHLHRYCAETSYRYNMRKITDKERFTLTLQNLEGRITYQKLIGK